VGREAEEDGGHNDKSNKSGAGILTQRSCGVIQCL
jgi:hypothetical protein